MNFVKNQFPAIAWAVFIFGLSSIEKMPTIKFFISTDKLAHLIVFFVLCFLSWRAFYYQQSFAWLKSQAMLFAFLLTSLYGLSDEFHQRFVPGRTYDLFDFLADSLGALIFVFAHWIYWKQKGSRVPQRDA